MTADGWVILSFVVVAVGYAFGVKMPEPVKVRARRSRHH
jgi:hypothetical protein